MKKKNQENKKDLTDFHQPLLEKETTKMYSGVSEREVLGIILSNDKKITEVLKYIPTSKVFYHEKHEVIWNGIYALYKSNKAIDIATLSNYLSEKGYKMTYYITGLIDIISSARLDLHAKTIYSLYIRRQLHEKIVKFEKRLVEQTSYKDVGSDIAFLQNIGEKFSNVIDVNDKSISGLAEEAEESIAVDYEGDSLEVGFNVSYLQDVLGVIGTDQAKITLSDANSSALLEESDNSDALYVVMPMRL